jgi:hypothetical protein
MRDRADYFRRYQRQRYARKTIARLGLTEESLSAFVELCEFERLKLGRRLAQEDVARIGRQVVESPGEAEARRTKLLKRAFVRARKERVPYTLDAGDFVGLPAFCPVLEIELVYGGDLGKPATAMIARREMAAGFVPGNVVVVSTAAGMALEMLGAEGLARLQRCLKN